MTLVGKAFLIRLFMRRFFFHLLMQAIEVEEHFHVQHATVVVLAIALYTAHTFIWFCFVDYLC